MAKTRRSFSSEFKAQAVKLVTEQGKGVAEVDQRPRSLREPAAGPEAVPGRGRRPRLPRQGQPARPRGGTASAPGRGQAAHDGARHPEKSDGLLRQGVVMRYDFVEAHRETWPVRLMCRVLRVSPGGDYDRRGRPQSSRAAKRDALAVAIEAVHVEVKARHGSPRIHAELVARGEPCCVNTVARLMRSHAVAATTKRKVRVTTDSNHGHPVADNVPDRRFEPGAPNRAWTADIAYIATGEGWLYLAAVEDLHSRRIVGWSMGSRIDSRLVVDALEMALARRRPGEGLVAHSDRGSQYAGEHYRGLLARHGIACSMSRRGNCWDNAPMESSFASLKKEPIRGEIFATREEARTGVFEYIEVFSTRTRRHSSPGYKSPAEYERAS